MKKNLQILSLLFLTVFANAQVSEAEFNNENASGTDAAKCSITFMNTDLSFFTVLNRWIDD